MKIGSWDVGLKNLSYCILEKSKINNYTILDWNNLNIVDKEPVRSCCGLLKNGKACSSKPQSSATFSNGIQYFCKKHEVLHAEIALKETAMIDNKYIYVGECGEDCSYVLKKKQIRCNKSARMKDDQGIFYCNAHAKKRQEEEKRSFRLIKLKKTNANTFPIEQLKLNLFKILDGLPQLLQVDEMIIENQPTFKNPRMKSISNALFDYFLIRGIVDKEKTKSTINLVRFMCPSNKLKVNNDNTISILSKTEDGEKYKLTKALAVQYCKQMIQDDKKHLDFLMSSKKKDDLSDCYLQGIYYLSKKN